MAPRPRKNSRYAERILFQNQGREVVRQTTTGATLGPIPFATFLTPNTFDVYRFASGYVGDELGRRTELIAVSSFDQFVAGQADIGSSAACYTSGSAKLGPRSNCWPLPCCKAHDTRACLSTSPT